MLLQTSGIALGATCKGADCLERAKMYGLDMKVGNLSREKKDSSNE